MSKNNPLKKLRSLGQSIWMDTLRRGLITSGELQHRMDEDGLSGITSNPAIFEKAIAGSPDYDEAIRLLALQGKSAEEMYHDLVLEDIRDAADLLRPVFAQTGGEDGFVSLEVNPHLAHDTAGTIVEARWLWNAVQRPNLMIKVPATDEGLPAIRQLISDGINVNITLLFGLNRYRQVLEAYLAGLQDRLAQNQPLRHVTSVASFFLSRIDVLLDPQLEKIRQQGGERGELAGSLVGRVAVAQAKLAYQVYQEFFSDPHFRDLAGHGAGAQKLLWASTGTKNPAYSDVMYVEPLISPQTINTMTPETIDAYRDHGDPQVRLTEDLEEAAEILRRLARVGFDLDQVAAQLEDEGQTKFTKPYDQMMKDLMQKREAALEEPIDRQTLHLGTWEETVRDRIRELDTQQFCPRVWRKDAKLWSSDPARQVEIQESLGWLHLPDKMEDNLPELRDFAAEIIAAGFRHVVLLGMGGSSLAPLAYRRIFADQPQALPLTVLDTTDPAAVREAEQRAGAAETLFILASKSGTTPEMVALGNYFYEKVQEQKPEKAGENFAAITDFGTPLADLALDRNFRRIFYNFQDVGGRYSALSYFGLAPAVLAGLDAAELLDRAQRMMHACASCVPARENPGIVLGAALGELARHGRDKVTFLLPESLSALGLWLEQLLAESTGKEETGILPVAGEPPGDPGAYGDDRIFVQFRLEGETDPGQDQLVASLRNAGHPAIVIQMVDRLDLGQEIFRWELATATAGSLLRLNPFDQPNVQEAKDVTHRLLSQMRQAGGKLETASPGMTEGPLEVYDGETAGSMPEALGQILGQANPGDYVALLAWVRETPATDQALQDLRRTLRDSLRLATTVGYGPRYLHSTGQFHKGGPDTGVFLLLTSDPDPDLPLPGQVYTLGQLWMAQALGDHETLHRRGRRILRIHLGADPETGLAALRQALEAAVQGVAP
ncbi:MAG: bifunctional transaldolase/phosoglucose isomerase [Candidatus Zixiibacteriota bacterium]|nr:MAG: bifunctional transaldolase/phosoglucose isomerase [candidate division Zixibacteria bacterium]